MKKTTNTTLRTFLVLLLAAMQLLTHLSYGQAQSQAKKIFPFPKNKKWILVNSKREPISTFSYDFVGKFYEGLAVVRRDGKEGYINTDGNEVIVPRFSKALPFSGQRAIVKLDGKQTIIDTFGIVISGQWYDSVFMPREGIFRVGINPMGKLSQEIITKVETQSGTKVNSDSILIPHSLIGYINNEGLLIGDYWFTGGISFNNGKAKVAIGFYTFYLQADGSLSRRLPDECDEAVMPIVHRPDNEATFKNNMETLFNGIKKRWKYPEDAVTKYSGAKVIVSFTINTEGKVIRPVVEKSVDKFYDEALVEAILKSPAILPPVYKGRPTCSKATFTGTYIRTDL